MVNIYKKNVFFLTVFDFGFHKMCQRSLFSKSGPPSQIRGGPGYFKGGFYSEGVDEFVISSNRQTLLFSWAWILNLWYFKRLKSCPIRVWSVSDGSNCALFCYLSLQSHFRLLFDMIWAPWNITNSKFKLRKIMRFVCLRKWEMYVSAPSE